MIGGVLSNMPVNLSVHVVTGRACVRHRANASRSLRPTFDTQRISSKSMRYNNCSLRRTVK
jgi:hypothetical protein